MELKLVAMTTWSIKTEFILKIQDMDMQIVQYCQKLNASDQEYGIKSFHAKRMFFFHELGIMFKS